jgi:hypothetical protein
VAFGRAYAVADFEPGLVAGLGELAVRLKREFGVFGLDAVDLDPGSDQEGLQPVVTGAKGRTKSNDVLADSSESPQKSSAAGGRTSQRGSCVPGQISRLRAPGILFPSFPNISQARWQKVVLSFSAARTLSIAALRARWEGVKP